MGDLSSLINDSVLWELFHQLGNRRSLKVEHEGEIPVLKFEIGDEENPVIIDLMLWQKPDSTPKQIYYRMHARTPNGTMYESNEDSIKGKRLKQSLKELVVFYGGLKEC